MGNANIYQATEYNSIEASLPNATVNQLVPHPAVEIGYYVSIINEDTVNDFTVRFNDVTNDVITVRAGQEKSVNNLVTEAIYLSNNSGSAINYQILIYGGKR